MVSRFKFVFLISLLLQLSDLCMGSTVGVAYGTDANNLPSPDKVLPLFRKFNIEYLRIYDTNPGVLKAFSNTGIELMVGVHNSDLRAFQSRSYVDSWLRNNIRPYYPAAKITYITVGNEVDTQNDAATLVVSAMRNVVSALKVFNFQDRIKVSTPLSFGALSKSFPPSEGAFKSSLAFLMTPLLDFLDENGSPFMVNLYPYFATDDSSLEYVLFKPTNPVRDPNTGLSYTNMFDAQLDAVGSALDNQNFRARDMPDDARLDDVRFSLARRNSRRPRIIVTETGWPTRGHKHASIENADTYNTNLIRHVTDGSGTPAMSSGFLSVMDGSGASGGEVDVYVFSLFDENRKGSEIEGSWGIFSPDMSSKYVLEFPGKGTESNGRSWCVASSQASKSDLQKALDWACGPGKADCSALQSGQQCFQPDNLVSHASFAFNNYYQKHGLTAESCSFGGTGTRVYNDPSYGNCIYNTQSSDPNGRTWCVASSQASSSSIQSSLDWACGPGKADCSSLQPNQICFQPDTLHAHASFAFNNYYQKNGATDASCSFRGSAIKVDKDPSHGNCIYHFAIVTKAIAAIILQDWQNCSE